MSLWNMTSRCNGRRRRPPTVLKARRDFGSAASRACSAASAPRHWDISAVWGRFGADLRDERFVAAVAGGRRDHQLLSVVAGDVGAR